MRIEQNNQYFNQNIGLGASLKGLSEKPAFQTSSRNVTAEPFGKANEKLGDSPQTQFARQLASATKRILELQVDPITKKVGNELVLENEDEYMAASAATDAVMKEKVELMKGLLEKQGIKGEITSWATSTYPSVYSEYYVETEGDGKNLFILELENGELVFAETDRRMAGSREDSQSWAQEFAELQRDLFGFVNEKGKLSVDELKELYTKFLGVDKLKKFPSEYGISEDALNKFIAQSDSAKDELLDSIMEIKSSEEKSYPITS